MKVPISLIVLAAGTILATAAAGYSAPAHRSYGENDRQTRIGQAQEERGEWYAPRAERFERMRYSRRGYQFSRESERHERFVDRDER